MSKKLKKIAFAIEAKISNETIDLNILNSENWSKLSNLDLESIDIIYKTEQVGDCTMVEFKLQSKEGEQENIETT